MPRTIKSKKLRRAVRNKDKDPEFKSCTGKVIYSSEAEANVQLEFMQQTKLDGMDFEVYACRYHEDHYHIGRKRQPA